MIKRSAIAIGDSNGSRVEKDRAILEFLQKALSFVNGKENIESFQELINRAENNLSISSNDVEDFGEDMVFNPNSEYDIGITKLDDDLNMQEINEYISSFSFSEDRIRKTSQKELSPFPGSEMLQTSISTMNNIVKSINRQPEMYSDDNSIKDLMISNNVPENEFEPVLNIIKNMVLNNQN